MPTSPGHRDFTHQHTAGAAYVFRHNGTDWDEEQILSADTDEQAYADFGTSVDIDDDAIIVGAPRYDESSNTDAGKAYIFRYAGGSWSEEDAVVAGDVEAGARFGDFVSISGSRAAIGATLADYDPGFPVISISDTGAAYIFGESGGSWTQSFKLHASDRAQNDGFASVSLEGDRLLVGALGETSGTGAAYVLNYDIGHYPASWDEDQIITASDADTGQQFGKAVALDGDRIVVGATYADAGSTNAAGAAYVFDYVSNDWDETVKLTALVPLVPSVATHSLNDHRARMMDPITGRWVTRDPLYYNDEIARSNGSEPFDEQNLFRLTASNPNRYLDPHGLGVLECIRECGDEAVACNAAATETQNACITANQFLCGCAYPNDPDKEALCRNRAIGEYGRFVVPIRRICVAYHTICIRFCQLFNGPPQLPPPPQPPRPQIARAQFVDLEGIRIGER